MVEKRRLGSTDLLITPIGLGTWALGGGDWAFGWGDQDEDESIAAIRRAVDLGINWVDTAAAYGLGRAEEIVARAIKDLPAAERPFIFTKCGLIWNAKKRLSHSLKADSIKREVEGSLRRLEVETIDLYQIHWPAVPPTAPAPDIEEGWSTLVDLRREGKVRCIGVSNFNVAQLERIRILSPVDTLQPPYSIIVRQIESDILPYCEEHRIGVIVYSPLQSGLLSGAMTRERIAALPKNDWRASKSAEFQEPNLTRNLKRTELLHEIGKRHGRAPCEVAIAWTLRHHAVDGAIVGARKPSQVDGFIGAMEFRLSEAEVSEIQEHMA